MSSRADSKKAAREARLAAEREEAARQRRQRTWALVGGSVLLAAIIVVVLIVVSSGGSDSGTDTGNVSVFDGIEQSGIALGDPKAPVTMVEYADPQCPFCKQYTADVLPDLVDKYVKPGDLRMELHLLTFIGPDSDKLARAAYAAGDQDLMWQWIDVAYARQEAENSGYATSDFIDSVSEAAGANVDQVNSDSGSEAVTKLVSEAEAAAQDAGISSTPSFEIGPTGGEMTALDVNQLETSAFEGPIDQQLADAGEVIRFWADRPTMVATALTLAGIAIASYLTWVHYEGISPVCTTGGCERVQASSYAEIGPIPVALLGLAGYVLILASLAVRGEIGRALTFMLTLSGFAFSLYLTYLEVFVIDALCQWCLASAIVMTLLFVTATVRLTRIGADEAAGLG